MKHYKYVMQENNFDCGIASLLTCFYNLGFEISKEKVKEQFTSITQGIKAYDLVRVSNYFNISARGVKCDVTYLKKEDLPCIAHIIKDKSYYHYIVILEIDHAKEILKIFDPAIGISDITFTSFNEMTTNIYILFDKKGVSKVKDKRFSKFLIFLFNKNKSYILKSSLLSTLFLILSIISNLYIQTLLEYLNNKNIYFIILIILFFFNINISKNIIDFYKNKLLIKLKYSIDRNINKRIINHLFHLPYKYFSNNNKTEVLSLVNDAENFKDIVSMIFINLSIDLLVSLFLIIYMISYNIIFLPIFLVFIFITFLLTYYYQDKYKDNFVKLRTSKVFYSSKVIESLNAFYSIKNLHMEKSIINKIHKNYYDVIKNNRSYSMMQSIHYFIMNNIVDIFYLLVIFIGYLLVLYKKFYVFDIILFSNLFYLLGGFINNILNNIVLFKIYKVSIIKILDILELEKEVFKNTKFKYINKISFNNVGFEVSDNKIFNNLNLDIIRGKSVFIHGSSGIGKSSLIKILLRYYDLSYGDILIDNVNLKNIDLKFIRDNITYIGQDEYLFTDTIYNNLNFLCSDLNKIKKALNTCLFNIDTNYLLFDNGINLSGGERKKLIVARGLICCKNILILDEVFNEIDILEERKILNNIFAMYKNLTVIFISHRYQNHDLFDIEFDFNKKEVIV